VALRLFMPYVGAGRGLVALPRVGDEVLAVFPGGDLDMGIAFWGMFNGVDTVPDGAASDVVLFEGRQGDSGVIRLRGHLLIDVERSETRIIGGDSSSSFHGAVRISIAKGATVNVTGDVVLGVNGNVTASVTGTTSVTAAGAVSISAAATLSITAAGAITMTAPLLLFN
jgi:type VI secretion system secreted protein VgrG